MRRDKPVLTYKIQLLIHHESPDFRKQVYSKLDYWQTLCFRSANMVMAHLYTLDQLKNYFYLTEEVQVKLADQKKDRDGILKTSRVNTTYQLLSRHYKGELPSDVYSNLNSALYEDYCNRREGLLKGTVNLPTYKAHNPIPFKGRSIKNLQPLPTGTNYCFNLFKLPFRTHFGHDRFYKKNILDEVYEKKIKLCDSSILLERGKIFWLMTVEREKERRPVDPEIIAEAHLGMEIPISVKVEGKARARIGSEEEFLHRKLAIQAAMKRIRSGKSFNRGQHGKTRKFKSLENFKGVERRYSDSKCHVYSRRLIDFCLKYQVGTLVLCQQSEKEKEAREEYFTFRNWGYFGLKEKILYKANKMGIKVIVE